MYAPNAALHFTSSHLSPSLALSASPRWPAVSAELCCCPSQPAPQPAFHPHLCLPSSTPTSGQDGKSGAVRGGWRPNCAFDVSSTPPLTRQLTKGLHELAASRFVALRERPATCSGVPGELVHRKKLYRQVSFNLFPSIFPIHIISLINQLPLPL